MLMLLSSAAIDSIVKSNATTTALSAERPAKVAPMNFVVKKT